MHSAPTHAVAENGLMRRAAAAGLHAVDAAAVGIGRRVVVAVASAQLRVAAAGGGSKHASIGSNTGQPVAAAMAPLRAPGGKQRMSLAVHDDAHCTRGRRREHGNSNM